MWVALTRGAVRARAASLGVAGVLTRPTSTTAHMIWCAQTDDLLVAVDDEGETRRSEFGDVT